MTGPSWSTQDHHGSTAFDTQQSIGSSIIGSEAKNVILLTSLSVNLCVVIWAGALWIQRHRILHRRLLLELASTSNAAKYESWSAEITADIILSILCVAVGVYVLTSSETWNNPFSYSASPTVTKDNLHDSDECDKLSGIRSCLTLALGRFIFALMHLSYRGTTDGLTTSLKFRFLYMSVTVVCLAIVVIYGEDVILAGFVLLIEADSVVEGVYKLIKGAPKFLRSILWQTLIAVVCVIGCIVSLVLRLGLIVFVSVCLQTHNPTAMSDISLIVSGFALIFYVVFAVIIVRRMTCRFQKISTYPLLISSQSVVNVFRQASLWQYFWASQFAMKLKPVRWIAGVNVENRKKDYRTRHDVQTTVNLTTAEITDNPEAIQRVVVDTCKLNYDSLSIVTSV